MTKNFKELVSMKKLFSIVAACLLSFAVTAENFKEGVHYEVISDKATASAEIKEYFSFYCGTCYRYESLAKRFKEGAKKNGYEFKKSHVDFLRAASPQIQHMLTKAYVASEFLKKPAINDAIFNHIHQNRSVFTDESDVRQLFIANGVEGDKFDKIFNSFPVKAAANQMRNSQNDLVSKGILKGVPTFIINGKYKIINKGFTTARTWGQLFDQIEELSLQLLKK